MRRGLSCVLALAMTAGLLGGAAVGTYAEEASDDVMVLTNEHSQAVISDWIADEAKIVGSDPTNLDPFYGNKSGKNIFHQVYQRLYGMDNDGQLYGVLAKDYEVDESGLVYTVHLYDGITDHEGRPFTAEDAVWSYHAWDEEGFAKNMPKLDIDNIVAIDDTTLQFTFDEPITEYNELFYYFGQNDMTTKAAYEASPSQLASDACGTGPYRITSYTPGVSVIFERNDDYWQTDTSVIRPAQMSNVRKITYYFINETEQKAVAVQTGTVDICMDLSYDAAQDFADGGIYDEGFEVTNFKNNDVVYLEYNMSDQSVMQDKNLRMAVGYAIDSDAVTACLGEGVAETVYGLGGTRYADWDKEYWVNRTDDIEHTYDPEKAKELIAESDYNGETIKIMCNTIDNAGAKKTMAEVIGVMLESVGLNYEIVALDSTTEKTFKQEYDKWDLNVAGMNANDSVVNLWYAKFDYSSSIDGDKTWFGLVDDEMISLLKAARNVETYSPETINAFAEYVVDNAIAYSLCETWQCVVYNSNVIEYVPYTGPQSQVLCGACTYVKPE